MGCKTPLMPIPVAGPFDQIGVDVVQLPMSQNGNKYAIVLMDYLTKWPEVLATKDQTALTIAPLWVEQIISQHGVLAEPLSPRNCLSVATDGRSLFPDGDPQG